MLKDYVTKTLTFLQMPGKSQKARGRHEQPLKDAPELPPPAGEEQAAEDLFETPVETDFDPEKMFYDENAEAPEATPEEVQEEPEDPSGQACFEAGMRLCESKRYAEALEEFVRAAGQGHMQAQFLCGHMYRRGIAAEPNDKLALAWFKRAAKQGYIEAQLACGEMYEAGLGTAVNMKRALSWYEQAAKQGALEAQLKCGRMYFCGRAETRNPKKARYWLEIAANSGSEEAQRLLRERF